MGVTNIEWTDRTWNPVVGCTKVSAGCARCYAKTLHDQRHKAHAEGKKVPTQYAKPFEEVQLMPERLRTPLSWKKPQRVFVNSVSDLFHEDIPDEFIVKCFAVMLLSQRHTYQVLTKRPERMRRIVAAPNFGECVYDMAFDLSHNWTCGWLIDHVPEVDVLPNVWLGTSVENQAAADERIPHLLATPAAVRFLSCEPLLSEVDLSRWLEPTHANECLNCGWEGARFISHDDYEWSVEGGDLICPKCGHRSGASATDGVAWCIVGGESGPGARRCFVGWVGDLVEQCRAAEVPVFVKQLGSEPMDTHECETAAGCHELKLRDSKGGDPMEWPEALRVRQFPKAA